MTNSCRLIGRLLPLLLLCSFTFAQSNAPARPAKFAAPVARITGAIDDGATVRLGHSRHPLANAANDRGRVAPDTAMDRMLLLLQPDAGQQAALHKLLDRQHDPSSSDYQHWLTPEDFAANFAPHPNDIQQITAWLRRHGFAVGKLARGSQWIEFSGTASQVEAAFHTEIHHYSVKGKDRIANAGDISIPQALASVVAGLVSLNNFPRRPFHNQITRIHRDAVSGQYQRTMTPQPGATANFTNSTGTYHYLSPEDWSRIYNTAPLLKNGTTGAGISIAVVGTDTLIELSDIRTFRQIFHLPAKDPEIIIDGTAPQFFPLNDFEVEADLDLEWSGAIAPDADLKFITAASTAATAGFDLAVARVVDDRLAPIMSVSIGGCEMFLGTPGNAFLNAAFRQAAAEGISVISASGDSGAAGCDPQVGFGPALFGPNVNGSASTPYDVAVGGTTFTEGANDATYWSAQNNDNFASAIGYIPEAVWNQSCDPYADPNACFGSYLYFLSASSGGPSSCTQSTFNEIDGTFTCAAHYAKPSWQTGLGVPDDSARDIPDISLAADANHDGYIVCSEGSCQTAVVNGKTVITDASLVGGTSAGAPAFSGVIALLEQQKGAYQGLLNIPLYQIAAAGSLAACDSSALTNPNSPSDCVFHDVTAGNNNVPGLDGSPATPGYDLATGLGSIDAANLVANWGAASKLAAKVQLAMNSTRTYHHGDPVAVMVQVQPLQGVGAPSGDFTIQTDSGLNLPGGALVNGRFTGGVTGLPGGAYKIRAHYSGDATFAAADSDWSRVNVAAEGASISVVPWTVQIIRPVAIPLEGKSVMYSQPFGLQMTLQGRSGVGTPTGTVTIHMDSKTDIGPLQLNGDGNVFMWLDHYGEKGLVPGKHIFVVTYSGDASFARITSAALSITVNKDGATGTRIFPLQTVVPDVWDPLVSEGDPVDVVVEVGTWETPWSIGKVLPSGTVDVIECIVMDDPCPGYRHIAGPLTLRSDGPLGPGVAQAIFRTTFPAGDHDIVATYAGDAFYPPIPADGPHTGDYFFTVNPASSTRLVVQQAQPAIGLGQTDTYSVSFHLSNPSPVPTGNVTLLDIDGLVVAGPSPLVSGAVSFTVPWNHAGQHILYAYYGGDSSYSKMTAPSVITLVNPAATTAVLSTSPSANGSVALTALVNGSVSGAAIQSPGYEFGEVAYFDSANGAAPVMLGGVPQILTVGNGNTSINTFQVALSPGVHVISARFLGNADWLPSVSNSVTLQVGGQATVAAK